MKFNKDLASIHAYLCADGYVVKNPSIQKHKYYHIALRNTSLVLLKDFQKKFKNYFSLKPIISKDKDRCKIGSKKIYEILTKNYSYYSYEWSLPKLSKANLRFWLRSFFDCEAWVELQIAKSRSIRLDCVNLSGLKNIRKALINFRIESKIKLRRGRNIYRLNICGLDDLKKFQAYIGFLHPSKSTLLNKAINSYRSK